MRSLLLLVLVSISIAINKAQESSCSDVASLAECADHEGCELCRMNISFAKVEFCVSEEIGEKLPQQMFTCGEDTPSVQLSSDECSDLDKNQCEKNASCSWCESAAVPSACYTMEQAKRLPAAVFSCDLPSIAQS